MGKILLDDFIKQRKYLIWLLLSSILATAIGFAFREIYNCVGIIIVAGSTIIYVNTYFDYPSYMKGVDQANSDNNDPIVNILRRKTYARSKFVEIITQFIVVYILMYIAFILDALDRGSLSDPSFSFIDNIGKIMFFPLILLLITSIITPFLFKIKRLYNKCWGGE